MTHVAVIIPALNEAGNIRPLVQELLASRPLEVIVVDNGSSDATALEAEQAGARVIREPRRGYGYACAAGAAAAQAADILAFMDADRSFLPSDLPGLLAPILNGEADLVLGARHPTRLEQGAMPFHQRFGNWLGARLIGLLYQLELSDLGPFRAIRRSTFQQYQMAEMTFGWPVEMIVKTARCGARIVERPVSYHNRRAGQSKVSGTIRGTFLAAWFILGTTLRYAARRSGDSLD